MKDSFLMRGLFPYRYHVISLPKPPFILSGFTCHCSPGTLTSLRPSPAPWGAPDRFLPLHYICLLAPTPVSGVFLLLGLPSFKLLADWLLNMTFSKNSFFIKEALLLLTQDVLCFVFFFWNDSDFTGPRISWFAGLLPFLRHSAGLFHIFF